MADVSAGARRRSNPWYNWRFHQKEACMKASACMIAAVFALASGRSPHAQFSVGTWVETEPLKGLTMTVEECCNGGRRLIFHVPLGEKSQTSTVESRFDGRDAPVLVDGKPNGETLAFKRVDQRRTSTVFKRNGKVFRTSTAVESADGRTLTIENEFIDPADGRATGKMTETYARK
jgi:hypothetical protein